jgi:hypothetical protein
MYPNDLYFDLVADRQREMIAAADAHRNRQLIARGPGWSIVFVRRSVGARLVRAGEALSGDRPAAPVTALIEQAHGAARSASG